MARFNKTDQIDAIYIKILKKRLDGPIFNVQSLLRFLWMKDIK